MNQYKRYIPIVALVLVALGVNLDKFGIDLQRLAGGTAVTTTTPNSNSTGKAPSKQSSNPDSVGIDIDALAHWSSTTPEINLHHVFA
ncbi:MAG: hypothetical protein ACR2PS_19535, partial [Pseudomonadales bacterium]